MKIIILLAVALTLIAVIIVAIIMRRRNGDEEMIEAPQAPTAQIETPTLSVSETALQNAERLLGAQNYDEAVSELKRALMLEPKNSAVMLKLLQVYGLTNQHQAFFDLHEKIQAHADTETIAEADHLKSLIDVPAEPVQAQQSITTPSTSNTVDSDLSLDTLDFGTDNAPITSTPVDTSLDELLDFSVDESTKSDNGSYNDESNLDLDALANDPDVALKSAPSDFDMELQDLDTSLDEKPHDDSKNSVDDEDNFSLDDFGLEDFGLEQTTPSTDTQSNSIQTDEEFEDFGLDDFGLEPSVQDAQLNTTQPDIAQNSTDQQPIDELAFDDFAFDTNTPDDNISDMQATDFDFSDDLLDNGNDNQGTAQDFNTLDNAHTEIASVEFDDVDFGLVDTTTATDTAKTPDSTFELDSFNVDLGDNANLASDSSQDESTPEFSVDDFDFSIDSASTATETTHTNDDSGSIDSIDADTFALDFHEPAPIAQPNDSLESAIETAPSADVLAVNSITNNPNFGADTTAEEDGAVDNFQVTLDLANSYLELGETESASRLLDEVIVGGNPVQKAAATAVRARL